VDSRLVGADEHAPAPEVAQVADRRLRLLGEPDESMTVVLQHAACLGQGAGLRRAIEELLAQLHLEAAHGLADRRLGPMHLRRGAREAPLVRDGQEDLERGEIHRRRIINQSYFLVISITLTSTLPEATTRAS
jgi:hypothetical protein